MCQDFYFTLFCFRIEPDLNVQLVLTVPAQAAALFCVIEQNCESLAEWLPWANKMQSIADEKQHLEETMKQFAADKYLGLTIVINGKPAGMIDLHNFRPGGGEIGYWIGEQYRGHGVMTRSVQCLTKYAFEHLRWNSIDILTRPKNLHSQHVALNYGFALQGARDGFVVFRKMKKLELKDFA
ncbi:MAG: GNAT family N-acetyltransferase [Lactobacillus sp.]|jgi:ribosomal-protein-serine acetyltransferase|nr:GNAT family N-acetyltransferase [Lactobacillus sp.]MCI1973658.1 GNAT family N-acetyltransferase [Lactobacillus sp.]